MDKEKEIKLIEALLELIAASKHFLRDGVVDETSGTIPLIEALEDAIEKAESII